MSKLTFDLNGEWQLTDTNHFSGSTENMCPPSDTSSIAVQVPGDIHPALVAAGRLPDPLYAMNYTQCTWTLKRDWWYRREFFIPQTLKN